MSTLTFNHPMIGRPGAYKPAAVVAAAYAASDAAAAAAARAAGPAFADRMRALMVARLTKGVAGVRRLGALRAVDDLRRLASQRAGTDPDLSARMRVLAQRIEAGEG